MLKILFITAYPPNRKTAGQNYSRQLIEDLSKDYSVDIIYWKYENHKPEVHAQNVTLTEKKITSVYNNILLKLIIFPLFSKRFSLMTAFYLRKISRAYDIVYLDFSQVFIYGFFIKSLRKYGMSHDVIIQKYNRTKLGKIFSPWIKWSEKLMLKNAGSILTFSQKDAALLKKFYACKSTVVPFFIENEIKDINLNNLKIKNYFVMYGAWNRTENQESLLWVIDNLPPNVSLLKIIGGGMPTDIIRRLQNISYVQYMGFVENPYPIIAESKALIAPLFKGAGVKVKAIESLALGTPIIGTDVTFEGLPSIETNALFNIKNKDDFRTAVEKLNEVDSLFKVSLREEFNKKYNIDSFKEQLDKLWHSPIDRSEVNAQGIGYSNKV